MNMGIRFIPVVLILLLLIVGAPAHAVVLCDWENSPDDCNDWGNQKPIDDPCNMPSKYEYATVGVTRGTRSLHLKQTGWDQNLAILLNYDQRVEFMANDQFSIDVTFPADTLGYGGWAEIYNITLNADGFGWNDMFEAPPVFWGFWNGSPESTHTILIDYSAAKDSMPEVPGYVEFIITTNSDPNRGDFYFDNAQLFPGPSEPYNDTVMADSPVLYLKFDSITPKDSSGNNYWVGYGGTIVLSGDSIGGGTIYLNESNVGAANQTTQPTLYPHEFGDQYAFAPDDITFEFWVKLEAIDQWGMFFQQHGSWENEDYAPGMASSDPDPGDAVPPSIRICQSGLDLSTGGDDFWYTNVDTPIGDNQWHHMVVTYDEEYYAPGDANSMGIQFYMDGSLANSTVRTDTVYGAHLGPELNHIVIGSANNALGGVYNNLTGYIDEFAIYAGVLSGDRIAMHYSSGVYDREQMAKTCEELLAKGQGLPGDADKDCDIDMDDLKLMIEGWLICNDPNTTDPDWTPDCVSTW